MHFQTSSLHPPHAPLFRQCFLLRTGFASDSLCQLSAVRRTSLITRSLVSRIRPYRVRFVNLSRSISSIGCLFTSSCSPPHLAVTQLLSVHGGKLRHRGTSTLLCTLSLKRTSPGFSRLGREARLTPGLHTLRGHYGVQINSIFLSLLHLAFNPPCRRLEILPITAPRVGQQRFLRRQHLFVTHRVQLHVVAHRAQVAVAAAIHDQRLVPAAEKVAEEPVPAVEASLGGFRLKRPIPQARPASSRTCPCSKAAGVVRQIRAPAA